MGFLALSLVCALQPNDATVHTRANAFAHTQVQRPGDANDQGVAWPFICLQPNFAGPPCSNIGSNIADHTVRVSRSSVACRSLRGVLAEYCSGALHRLAPSDVSSALCLTCEHTARIPSAAVPPARPLAPTTTCVRCCTLPFHVAAPMRAAHWFPTDPPARMRSPAGADKRRATHRDERHNDDRDGDERAGKHGRGKRDSMYPACTSRCDSAPADCAEVDAFLSTGCAKSCSASDAARARALMIAFIGGCTDSRSAVGTEDRVRSEQRPQRQRHGQGQGQPHPDALADRARASTAADLPEYMHKLLERDESGG